MKTLIYIAQTGVSVFESQVVHYLEEIARNSYFDKIILLAGVTSNHTYHNNKSIIHNDLIDLIIYKKYPGYNFFKILQEKEFKRILKSILKSNTIIHIRGQDHTDYISRIIKSLNIKNVFIVSDLRGVYEEIEIYLKDKINPIKYKLKHKYKKQNYLNALKHSNHISCVSESLKEHVLETDLITDDRISVNHCGAGYIFKYSHEHRNEIRRDLGIRDDDVLAIFVTGGDGYHQNTEFIVKILLEKGFTVLNLSKKKVNGAINLFVPIDVVPKYLCASDVGVIYRNHDIVNKVASPVKFSEYVCCGLPVISNGSIDMINNFIKDTGFGEIITDFNNLSYDTIKDLIKLNRELISNTGKKAFSLETIAKDYIRMYSYYL